MTRIAYILVLPLFAIFGQFWLFQEIAGLAHDLVDTVGLFTIFVFVGFTLIFYRNYWLQNIVRNLIKKVFVYFNCLPLFLYIESFFQSIKLFFITLKNKIKNK